MNQIKQFVTVLFLFFSLLNVHAQNMVDAGANQTIFCSGSVQLNATPGNGWVKLNTTGFTPGGINSVFFTSEQTGFAVGVLGRIYSTNDGGNSWIPGPLFSPTSLNSVYFINSTTGFIAGGSGLILKTTDGGSTWNIQISGTSASLNSICFTSPSTGYISGSATILKTTDGGTTWIALSPGVISSLNSICFSTPNIGYASGSSGTLLKTTDAGATWTSQTTGQTGTFYSIYFTTPTTGFIVGTGATILKTTDGTNWTRYSASYVYMEENGSVSTTNNRPLVPANLYSVCFPTATTGYCAGNYLGKGIMLKTIDGGTTWFEQPSNSAYKITSLCFPNENVGYASGNGYVMKRTNGAVNPLAYSWSPTEGLSNPNIANPVASPTRSITYSVHAFDPNNPSVSLTDSVNVSVGPLTVYMGAEKYIGCEGSVVLDTVITNYTGPGRLKYQWSPSTGLSSDTIANPTATVTSTTLYSLTVSTPDGCTGYGLVSVKLNPLMVTTSVDKTVVCSGTAQLSTKTNYTGKSTLHYKWTPSVGLSSDTIPNPVATVSSQSTYSVNVTSTTGCSATGFVTVRVSNLTANAGADKTVKCNETILLDSVTTNYNGTGKLRYKWAPSAGLSCDTIANPVVTGGIVTNYIVTVTAPSGCTASDNVAVNVTPLTVNVGADKTAVCGAQVQLGVSSINYTGTGLKYKWTPATGLNNDTIANPIAMAGNQTYTLTVTTPTGCTASDNINISTVLMDKPVINYVGINGKNKNILVWSKPATGKINFFNVYKETNVSNSFTKIGTVPFDSASVFIDTDSKPDVQSNKYKITIVDGCGGESVASDYHKTMHLSINKGINTIWNLIWEAYEGFSVSTYNIYRGTTPDNIQIIGSLSGSNTQFSDYTAPTGYVYYQIEAVSSGASGVKSPFGIKSMVETGYSSRSNIATNKNGADGLYPVNDISNVLTITPNPATNTIHLTVDQPGMKDMKVNLYNSQGTLVLTKDILQNNQELNISSLPIGLYLIEVKNETSSGIQKLVIRK